MGMTRRKMERIGGKEELDFSFERSMIRIDTFSGFIRFLLCRTKNYL